MQSSQHTLHLVQNKKLDRSYQLNSGTTLELRKVKQLTIIFTCKIRLSHLVTCKEIPQFWMLNTKQQWQQANDVK